MLYIAVSVTNNCDYCIHSHTAGARAKGMTDAMFGELLAVVGLANQTNALANGYRVPVDSQFLPDSGAATGPASLGELDFTDEQIEARGG